MSDEPRPLVAVIMGSRSDWDTLRHADETLARFGIPRECAVVSAHRTPVWMAEYASSPRTPRCSRWRSWPARVRPCARSCGSTGRSRPTESGRKS
jgi:AIR carboxylase